MRLDQIKESTHPAIEALREEIHHQGLTYEDIARQAPMSLNHLKNLMSGRTRLRVEDRDAICRAMGVDPQDIFLQRKDYMENLHFIDIRHLPPDLQDAIRMIIGDLTLHTKLLEMHAKRRKRRAIKK
ncbi:Helix-turn-helix domain-containing protein [Cedecea sp. NFIX57]|nr:Helix-turn-helix domain-containing protein [Cedecea sp. NFIX57]